MGPGRLSKAALCIVFLVRCGGDTLTDVDLEAAPTPTPTPPPGVTPPPAPTPRPTPPPTGPPPPTASIAANLREAKRRTGVPGSYDFISLSAMRALPLYGPEYTAAEFAAIVDIENRSVWTEGELVYFVRVADGGTYDRPTALGDWHLEVREPSTRTRAQTINRNVVVEITPHFQETRTEWSEALLRRLARFQGTEEVNPKGAVVRVYGWLMNDYVHEDLAGDFRGTSWKIHPVTRFEYFDEGLGDWVEVR